MQLASDRRIRADRLAHAWKSFINLDYVRLAPGQSLFDRAVTDARDEAVQNFLSHLEQTEDEDAEEVRRATLWLLNLPPDRFRAFVERARIPIPRFDPGDVHRFVELLWERAWGGDWHVPGFNPGAYQVVE